MIMNETLDCDDLSTNDIEWLADMIADALAQKHGRMIGSLSFAIKVDYTFEDEEANQ